MNQTNQQTGAKTFIEAVRESLVAAARYNSGDSVAPVAILWTDAEGEWKPIAARLRELMPELLTLGSFDPDHHTGPAIWMRCAIEGVLPQVKLPVGSIPVLYLPRVSRQVLRSPEECPDALKPLVELQYRGAVWNQVNGKDWTVEAFLVSEDGGLGLEVARDQKTHQAMLGALDALAATPIASLRSHKLEAEDFDRLMVGDTARDLLLWISDPAGTKAEWDAARWAAFKSRCQEEYGFDPESDGEIVAAESLGLREGVWSAVWRRFSESPSLYSGIPDSLKRSKPSTLLFDREPWPDENEKDEANLREALTNLSTLPSNKARSAVIELDKKHAERRSWVWARLGLSPLAVALGHLKTLANQTALMPVGETPDVIGRTYTMGAYQTDDAVLRAFAAVKMPEDQEAVRSAIQVLYIPWLDDTARALQAAVKKWPLPDSSQLKGNAVEADAGECIVFVDGLRYDVAQRLLAKAHERQLATTDAYRWAALPSVTPTAKPAVSPAATAIRGQDAGADFVPVIIESQKPVNPERLRDVMAANGYQVLRGMEVGEPLKEDARGWSECGEFDSLGHKLQAKMAFQIDEQVDLLLDRIMHILEAGWRSVRVVTDHGWLLVPGGLHSTPLKTYLTECKWARCAVIKEGAAADVPTANWFWDPHQHVALAPGAYSFVPGLEYTHGGISLQECLIPDLRISNLVEGKLVSVTIESIQWVGQRCRVQIKPPSTGIFAVLRTKPNDSRSAICAPKPLDNEGRAGLLVEDDGLAGTSASLIVFDAADRVLCKQPTTVGGEV